MSSPLRVIFMGTPDFAVPSLKRIIEEGYEVPLVVSVPDRPQGRGRKVQPTAVTRVGRELGLRVETPQNLKDQPFRNLIVELLPDVICVVAFRILPESIFSIPPLGSFNLHGSLLPAYRGAAPINRAIMAGEGMTGVTTFFLKRRVDTGNIILQKSIPIGPEMTAGELHDIMAIVGADAVVATLKLIQSGDVPVSEQSEAEATPAPKIFPVDCEIDWHRSAEEIHNQVRGLSPYPGAVTWWREKRLKLLRISLPGLTVEGGAGLVTRAGDRVFVNSSTRKIELNEVQLEGKGVRSAAEFINGYPDLELEILHPRGM
jgi:methionyl-tRNA formyltransferase